MKKSIIMISAAVACVAACSLGACSSNKTDEYDKLNSMLGVNYSQIDLTVTETFDEYTSLESTYEIKYSESEIRVEYTVERFSSLSLDNPSTDYKTTYIGTTTIKDGVATVTGYDAGITESFAKPKFSFSKSYFENVNYVKDMFFSADVKNTASFWGLAVSCTDMKVTAVLQNDAFSTIKIKYTQNNVGVEYNYIFSH